MKSYSVNSRLIWKHESGYIVEATQGQIFKTLKDAKQAAKTLPWE